VDVFTLGAGGKVVFVSIKGKCDKVQCMRKNDDVQKSQDLTVTPGPARLHTHRRTVTRNPTKST